MYRRPAPTVAQRAAAIEHLDLALMHLARYRAVLLKRGGDLDLAKVSGAPNRATERLDTANRLFSQILEVRGTRVTALRKMSSVDGEPSPRWRQATG